ncbi:hypothetical protein GDO86_002843 [Hymenochirus boettgeri]|uniref:Uncharacterized protein n=1 Tax=Hymenochirus boettgeri TaxID=247094 RepID=A0A8T2K6S6_9PIPI|nr:hypothetical protein GDO86_002843 [Hymenochirus boettgeri]
MGDWKSALLHLGRVRITPPVAAWNLLMALLLWEVSLAISLLWLTAGKQGKM